MNKDKLKNEKITLAIDHAITFPERKTALESWQKSLQEWRNSTDSTLEEIRKLSVHNNPSPVTIARLDSMQESLDDVVNKINIIFPNAEIDMKEALFWKTFWEKITRGGNALKWVVGVVVAVLILTGYGKTLLLSWLNLKH